MGKNESSLPKIPGVSWPDRDCRYMELEGCGMDVRCLPSGSDRIHSGPAWGKPDTGRACRDVESLDSAEPKRCTAVV